MAGSCGEVGSIVGSQSGNGSSLSAHSTIRASSDSPSEIHKTVSPERPGGGQLLGPLGIEGACASGHGAGVGAGGSFEGGSFAHTPSRATSGGVAGERQTAYAKITASSLVASRLKPDGVAGEAGVSAGGARKVVVVPSGSKNQSGRSALCLLCDRECQRVSRQPPKCSHRLNHSRNA